MQPCSQTNRVKRVTPQISILSRSFPLPQRFVHAPGSLLWFKPRFAPCSTIHVDVCRAVALSPRAFILRMIPVVKGRGAIHASEPWHHGLHASVGDRRLPETRLCLSICTVLYVSHATIPAELAVDHPYLEVLVESQIRTAFQPVDLLY